MIAYLLLYVIIIINIYSYINFIINKSKLEKDEELYLRLIYNKVLYFKYMTDNEMNMKINEMNMKINEIIDMYNIYLTKFRRLNSSKYIEISKIIKKYNIKYLVLQNIKEMLIYNKKYDIFTKITSLIYEINPKYDIESNNDIPLFFKKTQNRISIIST